MRAGKKVYLGEQAARAEDHFFRRNLIALRELSLTSPRRGRRADGDLPSRARYRVAWPAGERILVCIGPSPRSSRPAARGAAHGERARTTWYAVVVETPGMRTLARGDRERLEAHLRQAEEMGAEPVRLSGESVARAPGLCPAEERRAHLDRQARPSAGARSPA
ncbi:MAG: hypothetical protein U0527_04900 [Candidatus Eisenbacteria bacterium]